MKNTFAILFSLLVILSSCKGDNSANLDREMELLEREQDLADRELELLEAANTVEKEIKAKTPEQLRQELALKECETPLQYLSKSNESVKGIYKNALSLKFNGFKVKLKLHNSATLMTFKNVECRVTLSSNSGSTILAKDFKVNEFAPAGRYITYTGEFECTNQQYEDTDTYNIEILNAECH